MVRGRGTAGVVGVVAKGRDLAGLFGQRCPSRLVEPAQKSQRVAAVGERDGVACGQRRVDDVAAEEHRAAYNEQLHTP